MCVCEIIKKGEREAPTAIHDSNVNLMNFRKRFKVGCEVLRSRTLCSS